LVKQVLVFVDSLKFNFLGLDVSLGSSDSFNKSLNLFWVLVLEQGLLSSIQCLVSNAHCLISISYLLFGTIDCLNIIVCISFSTVELEVDIIKVSLESGVLALDQFLVVGVLKWLNLGSLFIVGSLLVIGISLCCCSIICKSLV
jgi:hypothetical protein